MKFLICTLYFLAFVFAAPSILIPSKDDWYNAPPNFENAKLGSILKIRKAPHPIKNLYLTVKVKNTWQILYRSENTAGNPTAVVTTVFEPFNAKPNKLVSYQTAEDAASINCSPSYAFMNNDDLSTVVTQIEMFLIQTALEQGYYVASPDYEGPKGSFCAGHQAGKATLDGIRAVLSSSNTTGVNSEPDVVMWGYSGGTIASGWAAALQPTYAKELKPYLKGAALGGWVTNVTATAESIEGTIFAGLVPNAIAGLSNEYPKLFDYINNGSIMVQSKRDSFNKAYNMCLLPAILKYAFTDFFSTDDKYFTQGWDVLRTGMIPDLLKENTLGLGKEGLLPEIPIFVFHGEKDTIVPFKDSQRTYENWCSRNISSMEFAVSSSTGHITEVIEGSGAAFAWLKKRLEGEAPVQGCTRTERFSNLFYPGAFSAVGGILQGAIDDLLGDDIGPNAENLTIFKNRLVRKDQVPVY